MIDIKAYLVTRIADFTDLGESRKGLSNLMQMQSVWKRILLIKGMYAKNRPIDQNQQIAKEVMRMQLLVEGERFIFDNHYWGDLLS